MSTCPSCGLPIGNGCWNPQECAEITRMMQTEIDQRQGYTSASMDYGMTPAQLHAGIDKLWKALRAEGVQRDDCFTMAAAEIERLREGIRNWAYCMDQGMKSACPEKVDELADFLISCGVAPYSVGIR